MANICDGGLIETSAILKETARRMQRAGKLSCGIYGKGVQTAVECGGKVHVVDN